MRRSIHVSCIALLTALLAACGGGGGDGAAAGLGPPSSSDTTSQPPGGSTGSAESAAPSASAASDAHVVTSVEPDASGASGASAVTTVTTGATNSGAGVVSNGALVTQSTVDVQVKSMTKVSETRVSRTVFDYVFQVELLNTGAALTNVKGTVTAAGDGTTIIDGSVVVGDMAAGQTIAAADTITLRHDRTKPFVSTALVWGFTSETGGSTVPGILLPGNAGDLAVEAIPGLDTPRSASDLATALDTAGQTRYYLKQLQAVISASASVGQVNAALQSVDGRIVWATERNHVVTIQVLNDGDLQALSAIAAALEASPAFNNVSLVVAE